MAEQASRSWLAAGVGALVVLALGGGLALLLRETERRPDGPAEVIWDGDVCAHCRMHVGEPAFAAQVQTVDGEVLNFDDPGCLFDYTAEHAPTIRATWFHHHLEDRWIPADRTAFVRVAHSPMGYGLGAVEVGPEAELSLEAARRDVLAGAPTADHVED